MAMNFDQVCRLCLEFKNLSCDIFTSYYMKKNTLYVDMISKCTSLKPCQEDGLPRQICKSCCRQLKKHYLFNIQCETSDSKLRSMLHQQNAPTNEEYLEFGGLKTVVKCEELDELENKLQSTDLFESLLKTNPDKDEEIIKLEHDIIDKEEESSWSAEDDNTLLTEIKSTRLHEDINTEEKPKKKRGRKKKLLEGGPPSVPESKLPHQCDICGKFLSNKSNLKAHKICHTDLRPYKCNLCTATFRGHSALYQHKKVHTGETPYVCDHCPKQFSRRTGLVNHVRVHTGVKQYGCDICFKTFVQSAQLSIHMKRHKGDKSFLCQDCGKGFPIKADLKVHQRIHNGEKPYSCHMCTKTFATSGNLSIHIRIHNKEIRYHCKECNRGFVTCSSYKVHLKRHQGQRDYRCDCGKTFYTSSALKQHRVVHTGEKKYQCKICERKFSQTSHLSRHFKRNHEKADLPAPPSDQYKVVIHKDNITYSQNTNSVNVDVKCEGS